MSIKRIKGEPSLGSRYKIFYPAKSYRQDNMFHRAKYIYEPVAEGHIVPEELIAIQGDTSQVWSGFSEAPLCGKSFNLILKEAGTKESFSSKTPVNARMCADCTEAYKKLDPSYSSWVKLSIQTRRINMKRKPQDQQARPSEEQSIVSKIRSEMSDERREELRQLGRDDDALHWKIADEVAKTYTEAIAQGIPADIMHACAAVQLESNVDYSAFRIYDFYLVGQKLSTASLRRKAEHLPFSHLLFARQHSEASDKITFLEIINMDIQLMHDNKGQPVAKYVLEDEVKGTNSHRSRKTTLDEMADHGRYAGQSFKITDLASAVDVCREILEAGRYIQNELPKLQTMARNSDQSRKLQLATQHIAQGVKEASEFILTATAEAVRPAHLIKANK